MRAGLDGVPGLVQELADVTDALVDCLGPDAEQDGDGDLGQRQALVEGGGQEPVCQGQDRAAAGAGSGQPRAVAAALIQARLPLLVMQAHQRGDQGVPLPGRQPGQRRVAEPGQGVNSLTITVFGEEKQSGDRCEHALELADRAAVAAAFPAKHPPCLHLCHGVLDDGADLAEDRVEFSLPVEELRSCSGRILGRWT